MTAEQNPWVMAYHPGLDQETRVRESAMLSMRLSGWVTLDEHQEMQAHLAKQAEAVASKPVPDRDTDTSAAAGKAASGKEK
jgi:hypothetical protein